MKINENKIMLFKRSKIVKLNAQPTIPNSYFTTKK